MTERIVLAYTGSLRTSTAIRSMLEADRAEVVTLTLDIGQGRDLEEIRDRALATGAARAHVLDVREEFAHDFVLPALQAGALHEGPGPLGEALALPLIASKLLEIAAIEHATAIAHGCTRVNQERMVASVRALESGIRVIAMGPVSVEQHTHANLWGRAYPVAKSETPDARTQPRAGASDMPVELEIAFERGVPAAINGVPMPLTELIESLSIIAGQHGVGWRAEEVRDVSGAEMYHVYEAPAAVVLHAAHAALETSVLPLDLLRLKREKAVEYAHLVSCGQWFTVARRTLHVCTAKLQDHVTGSVRITLLNGTLFSAEAAEREHAAVPCT